MWTGADRRLCEIEKVVSAASKSGYRCVEGEEELPATTEHEELPASASADDVRQWLEERAMAGPYSDPYGGMARLDGRSRLIFDSMFSTTAVTSHQDLDKMRRWGRRPSDDTALQETVMALSSYGAK